MVDKATTSTNTPKYWLNGQYIEAKKDSKGFYYIDENGNRVDLSKPLLKFTSEPFEGIIASTKQRIQDRKDNISLLEKAIETFKADYKIADKKLGEYLASLGINIKERDQLTGMQNTQAKKYEDAMSLAHRLTNRANMEIRGDLLSNFMDSCDLMKWGA